MVKSGVTRISISLPPSLLQDFDKVIQQLSYDRSKAIQQAMRDFLSEYRWEHGTEDIAVGTITLIYDHHVRQLETTLTEVQHHNHKTITSTIHIHLDDSHCLLVIVVKGKTTEIQGLAGQLQRLRGVKQLKLTSLMVGPP